jgi:hypothetical protein
MSGTARYDNVVGNRRSGSDGKPRRPADAALDPIIPTPKRSLTKRCRGSRAGRRRRPGSDADTALLNDPAPGMPATLPGCPSVNPSR